MRAPPRCLAAATAKAFILPLRIIAGDHPTAQQLHRAWTLFLLVPRLLLHRSADPRDGTRAALLRRANAFQAGGWQALLRAAHHPSGAGRAPATIPLDSDIERRCRQACAQVRAGDLSRARSTLTSAALAPGTADTLAALTDPTRRPPALTRPLPDVIPGFQPEVSVHLSQGDVAESLRTAKRGAAPGLSGASMEHYKLLLESDEGLQLFTHAVNQLANAAVPGPILRALALARLTALSKPGGAGARGIATGDALRRLTARTLARTHAGLFDRAARPFQFALQARAGTDALAGLLRAALDADDAATVVSMDGRSAYDTISRAAVFAKLLEVAPALVPFVRAWYGGNSTYLWWDAAGAPHRIAQGEGLEQGDALAPALFALGQHDALAGAAATLHPADCLLAYLDDLYVVTTPERARAAYDVVTRAVHAHAGISANSGKTRVYSRGGGAAPPGIADLGPEVWRGDRDAADAGFVAVGVPVGDPAFIQAQATARLAEEQIFLDALQHLPDLQCAWLLLLYCGAPRGQHLIRTVPPSLAERYAQAHDDATWRALCMLLHDDPAAAGSARQLAFLPARLGGLGLFPTATFSPAAYWAAWADALPVIAQRRPEAAARCAAELALGSHSAGACFREAAAAGDLLTQQGWAGRPAWDVLLTPTPGPPRIEEREPSLWPHGWQHAASLATLQSLREQVVFPALTPAGQALLRSQAGPHAGAWLTAIPSDASATLLPRQMHLALRRRLRMPLPVTRHRCGAGSRVRGCGGLLDPYGDHALACPRSGALARRASILEQAWIRVAREAVGPEGRVVPQQALAATHASVPAGDLRRLDFVVHGATPHGEALCCDATLVSPLTRAGAPAHRAHAHNGAALDAAHQRKRQRYPELLQPGPQRLLVLAAELGGRWHADCHELLRLLVATRAPRAPAALRVAAAAGWRRRWWGLLGVAVQRAVATTALGGEWLAPPQPAAREETPPLAAVSDQCTPEACACANSRTHVKYNASTVDGSLCFYCEPIAGTWTFGRTEVLLVMLLVFLLALWRSGRQPRLKSTLRLPRRGGDQHRAIRGSVGPMEDPCFCRQSGG
eukprot:s4199_g1.t1